MLKMKFISIVTIIYGFLAPVISHNTDTLVFTQTLENANCPEANPGCLNKGKLWKIKALSILKSTKEKHENCLNESREPFVVSSDLKYKMIENWSKLTAQNVDDLIKRWWDKDGTCVKANLKSFNTPDGYFSLALELMKKYSMDNVLSANSASTNASQIENNVKEVLKVQPRLDCVTERDESQHLTAVKLCFSNKEKLVHCPRYVGSTCEKRKKVVVPKVDTRNKLHTSLSIGAVKNLSYVLVFEQSFPEFECQSYGRNCLVEEDQWKIKRLAVYERQEGKPKTNCKLKESDKVVEDEYQAVLINQWLIEDMRNSRSELDKAMLKDGSCVVEFMPEIKENADVYALGLELLRKYNMSRIFNSGSDEVEIRKYRLVEDIMRKLKVMPIIECSHHSDGFQYFSSVKLCLNDGQKLIHCPKAIKSSCTGNSYRWHPNLYHRLKTENVQRSTLVLTQTLEKTHCSMADPRCQNQELVWKVKKLSLINSSGDDIVACSTGAEEPISTLVSLKHTMIKKWAGLTMQNIDNEIKTHWEKEGTCVKNRIGTIETPDGYFTLGLELMRKFSMDNIIPVNFTLVDTPQIEDIIRKVLKVQPRLDCAEHEGNSQRLTEVKLCLNNDEKLISCPRYIRSTCEKGKSLVQTSTAQNVPKHLASGVVRHEGNFLVLSMAITENLCLENRLSNLCRNPESLFIDDFKAISYETQKPLTKCTDHRKYPEYTKAERTDPITANLMKSWKEYGNCISQVVRFLDTFEEYQKNAVQLFHRYIGRLDRISEMKIDKMKSHFHGKKVHPVFRCSALQKTSVNYIDLCFNHNLKIIKCPAFMTAGCLSTAA